MNSRYSLFTFLAVLLTIMTSCLSSEEQEVQLYNDAAITTFQIGNLKRTVYSKTSAGKDTSTVSTSSYSTYPFTIDHNRGLIYNLDSLPTNVSLEKTMPTVYTMNSGYVYLKNLDNDSLTILSTDSVDLSKPRMLRCYANDGSWYRDYTVEVRVHREAEDSVYWQEKPVQETFSTLSDLRMFSFKEMVVTYGYKDGQCKAFSTLNTDGDNWSEMKLPVSTSYSFANNGNRIFVLTAEPAVYSSENGENWTREGNGENISKLLGASRSELYALSSDHKLMKSVNNGGTWEEEYTGNDTEFLPSSEISVLSIPSKTNSDMDKVVMIGNRDVETDIYAVVWTKIADSNNPNQSQTWMYQPFNSHTWHRAPSLHALNVIYYEDRLILIGGKGKNGNGKDPFAAPLISEDYGLNWYEDERYYYPSAFYFNYDNFAMTADTNNRIWMVCGGTGQVWRGYLSQLTWK